MGPSFWRWALLVKLTSWCKRACYMRESSKTVSFSIVTAT
jgi:hypothetical protein